MIQSNRFVNKTYYEIIGVNEDASQEEIRRTYRSAILNSHPDKLQNSSETPDHKHETSDHQFLEVQRAWEVLGDLKSRALYDNELRKSRHDSVNADDVSLDDMVVEDVGGGCFELYYNCRCGDSFAIDSSELAEMGYPFSRNGSEISLGANSSFPASILLPCGSCSLKIRLVIDANGKISIGLNN